MYTMKAFIQPRTTEANEWEFSGDSGVRGKLLVVMGGETSLQRSGSIDDGLLFPYGRYRSFGPGRHTRHPTGEQPEHRKMPVEVEGPPDRKLQESAGSAGCADTDPAYVPHDRDDRQHQKTDADDPGVGCHLQILVVREKRDGSSLPKNRVTSTLDSGMYSCLVRSAWHLTEKLPPRSASSSDPKTAGESKRGRQHQSMVASVATNATVWRSPMMAW